MLAPVSGCWKDDAGNLICETNIPVRVACDRETIYKIADMAMEIFAQDAVMFYLISDSDVYIRRNKNA